MEYPLSPHAEIFKWGPVPFFLYYGCNPIVGLLDKASELYPGYGWPRGLILLKERRMIWMHDEMAVNAEGRRILLDHFLDRKERNRAQNLWQERRDALLTASAHFESLDLSELSDSEFLAIWQNYHEIINTYWAHGMLPELAGYGAIGVLREQLESYVPPQETPHAMEILSAPEALSFYQQEEVELAQTDDLEIHQQKYYWLNNSYTHVEILPVSFFKRRKAELSTTFVADTYARIDMVRNVKRAAQERYKLPESVMEIANAMWESIVWQDGRKRDTWIYLHYTDMLLTEAVKRFSLNKEQCLQCRAEEIFAHIEQGAPLPSIADRDGGFGFIIEDRHARPLPDEQARAYWMTYVEPKHIDDREELRGVIACKGRGAVRGTARLVFDPKHSSTFNEGDILVAPMTTPDYVFLMKIASAILTDTGGLTSHAAIVSRELGVPCIIGTKIATQVLKDGDMVEVDAEKGVARILERTQRR